MLGVYTFRFRRPKNDRFSYEKTGTGWRLWWVTTFSGKSYWVVGLLRQGDLEELFDTDDITEYGEAWSREDKEHPCACESWTFKARNWVKGGRTNTPNGVITNDAAALACGEKPFRCEPVGDPPMAILVVRPDDTRHMAGIYFLMPDLHNSRCAFEKQVTHRGSTLLIYYQPNTGKWLIERPGPQGRGKADACCLCDSPDPTAVVSSSWHIRGRRDVWVRSGTLSVVKVGKAPDKIFVMGAVVKKVHNNQVEYEALPMNGVYVSGDEKHNCRHLYRKEVGGCLIRFHVESSRWIIDGRKNEVGDGVANDTVGISSTKCDCWHPAAADTVWQLWHEGKRKSQKKITQENLDVVTKKRNSKPDILGASAKKAASGRRAASRQGENGRSNSALSSEDGSASGRDSESVASSAQDPISSRVPSRKKTKRQDEEDEPQSANSGLLSRLHSEHGSISDLGGRASANKSSVREMLGLASKAGSVRSMSTMSSDGRGKFGPSGLLPSNSSSGSGLSDVMRGRLTKWKLDAMLKSNQNPSANSQSNTKKPTATPGGMKRIIASGVINEGDSDHDSESSCGSMSSVGSQGWGSRRSLSGRSNGRVSIGRMSIGRGSVSGRSMKSSRSMRSTGSRYSLCSSRQSSRKSDAAGSVKSSQHGSQASSTASSVDSARGESSDIKKKEYDSWTDYASIIVLGVSLPPDKIHVSPTEPAELAGTYVNVGLHNGRPVFKLVDEKGEFKTSFEEGTRVNKAMKDADGAFTELYAHRTRASSSASSSAVSQDMMSPTSPTSPRNSSSASCGDSGVGSPDSPLPARQTVRRVRKAGAFDFCSFGYVIRWHPESMQWILSEATSTLEVRYEWMAPRYDLGLTGGRGEPVKVLSVRDGGLAHTCGLEVNSELVSVNGDKETFQYSDAQMLLEDWEAPTILIFRTSGTPVSAEGLMYLKYDSPYPSSVLAPWVVPFDGGMTFPVEKPVQLTNVEMPPKRIRISGYRGSPRDVNGVYDLLPILWDGRAAYQSGRWAMYWVPHKRRWVLGSDTVNSGRPFAKASCCAPHPACITDHGAQWEVNKKSKKSKSESSLRVILNVVAAGSTIGIAEFEDIVANSLQRGLDQADALEKGENEGNVDGRRRWNASKINAVLSEINIVLNAVEVFSLTSELITSAKDVRRRLSGRMTLASIYAQGEKSKATVASWMETLTELKARLRQDHADTSVAYEDGWTAMHLVAQYGYNESWTYEASDALRQYGGDIEARTKCGFNPMCIAMQRKKLANVRAFVRLVSEKGQHIPEDRQPRLNQEKAFLTAAEKGDAPSLRAFSYKRQVDMNVKSPEGRCALHIMTVNRNASGVEIIVRDGTANPNEKDDKGDTALHLAAAQDSPLITSILLRNGASPIVRNARGRTPYMVALEVNSKDVIAEYEKVMLPWDDIEGVIGRKRYDPDDPEWENVVRNKAKELLRLGFGDRIADPLKPARHMDRLQLANQAVVLDPDPDAEVCCCCLELRGRLVCRELLLPLLKLTGESRLEIGDFVKYKNFVKYLFSCGFAAFSGVQCILAVQKGMDQICAKNTEICENHADRIREAVPECQFFGRALGHEDKPPWPMLHHYYAHGELPWLSADGNTNKLNAAVGALADVNCIESIEELWKCSFPSGDRLNKVQTEKGFDAVIQPFWDNVYAHWLTGNAKQAEATFMERCGHWGTKFHMKPLKSYWTALEMKTAFRSVCNSQFGQAEGAINQPHMLEAGGIVDIMACQIDVSDVHDIGEIIDEFAGMSTDLDQMELVAVKNDFWNSEDTKKPKYVRLYTILDAPGCSPFIVEVQLVLKKHLVGSIHLELFEEFESGAYTEAGQSVRQGCSVRLRGAKSTPLGVGNFRHRFALSGNMAFHQPTVVWCWASPLQLDRAEMLGAPSKAHVICADGSLQNYSRSSRWIELRSDFTHINADKEHYTLDRVVSQKDMQLDKEALQALILAENLPQTMEDRELERLGLELVSCNSRLFRNHKGQLTKVRDYVILQVVCPGEEVMEGILMRETKPRGFPIGPRRASETLQFTAKRLIGQDLPSFLQPQLMPVAWNPEHDKVWILPELDEDANGRVLPAARRYFQVRALFIEGANPFSMLRAGLGVEAQDDKDQRLDWTTHKAGQEPDSPHSPQSPQSPFSPRANR